MAMIVALTVAAVIAGVVLVLAAVAPATLARLVLLAYPAGHPRRDELVADLHFIGAWGRFCWVLELVEVVTRDAIPESWRARRRTRVAEVKVEAPYQHRVDLMNQLMAMPEWAEADLIGQTGALIQVKFGSALRDRDIIPALGTLLVMDEG
jgi:hypothetical protein